MSKGEDNAAQPPIGQWTTGLYDCCDDTGDCCYIWCNPSSTFSQNVEIIDQGRTSRARANLIFLALRYFGLQSLYTYKFRSKLRALYSLPEEPHSDCCVHCCCLLCAICQEHKELKNRGFDPSKGWKANEERLKEANLLPPSVAPAMTR